MAKATEQATLTAAQIKALDDAYSDGDKTLATRVRVMHDAMGTVSQVKAIRSQMIEAGAPNVPTEAVLGWAAAAVVALNAARYATPKSVADKNLSTLVREAKRVGAPALKRAAVDTMKPIGDNVASAERLAMILDAVAALPTKAAASGAKRAARPNDGANDDAADESAVDVEPIKIADHDDAAVALVQSLANALKLIRSGVRVTEQAAELLADLAAESVEVAAAA